MVVVGVVGLVLGVVSKGTGAVGIISPSTSEMRF